MKHDLLLFFGRFHPLLVHLPIGGLVLLGFLELVAALTRWKVAAQTSRWILGFVTVVAVASAIAGWMLAREGAYDAQLLRWHRALGMALAPACLITFLLRCRENLHAYRVSLATALTLLVIVGHLGGSLTHGPNFLTRYAPALLRPRHTVLAHYTGAPPSSPLAQQPVFEAVIQPILQRHCGDCHGTEKHKAQLQIDSLAGWLRGEQDGPVIRPGRAKESPLVQRMLLPPQADGHMPPEGQPQLTPAEVALIEWWINAGASTNATLSDLETKPEIRRSLEVVSAQPAARN